MHPSMMMDQAGGHESDNEPQKRHQSQVSNGGGAAPAAAASVTGESAMVPLRDDIMRREVCKERNLHPHEFHDRISCSISFIKTLFKSRLSEGLEWVHKDL